LWARLHSKYCLSVRLFDREEALQPLGFFGRPSSTLP
jgi:hypothetical protein